jgi:protein TonB
MSVATMGSPMNNQPPDEDTGKLKTALWVVVGVAVLALIAWGISHINLGSGGHKPKQQTVKIMLPDAPPPPPPKPQEKRPEPKQDNKPQPQQQEQKPQPVQQEAQPLKMEGAAGNGPSAFSSGSVSSDYKGGAVGIGPGGTAPVSAEDRRKAQFYANNIRRQLKDELEKHLDTDARELVVSFAIWISADGHLSKFELIPSGDAKADADARHAFEEAAKSMRLERPGDVVQPLRLKLTLLPPGQ